MTQDLEKLKDWIGRKEHGTDYVTVPLVDRLAATLDRDDAFAKIGDPLPIGWHSTLFPHVVRRSQIGPDGHPARGDFLPPVPLPRRMFAGQRTTFHAPLLVGDEVRKEAEITGVNIKQGRTGTMVFVTVRHTMSTARGVAVVEDQDIVYRGEPDPNAPPAPAQPASRDARWTKPFTADEVTLFRYSALTFNGHRIHYDHPYVTKVEGYRGLVMNGGLTTLLVYELARDNARSPVTSMTSRNVRPLFANEPFTFCGEPSADGATAKLWVVDKDGALALSAEATFA